MLHGLLNSTAASEEVYDDVMAKVEANHTVMEAYGMHHCSLDRELNQVRDPESDGERISAEMVIYKEDNYYVYAL